MEHALVENDELFIKKGSMKKSPLDMNKAEKDAWEKEFEAEIRERIFAIGQPLVYGVDGKFVAEYVDGRIKTL